MPTPTQTGLFPGAQTLPTWAPGFPHQYLFKPLDQEEVAVKTALGKCVSHRCPRPRSGRSLRCNTCLARIKRMKDEARYVFDNLRVSAKRRGIPFRLEITEFREWLKAHDFLTNRGKSDQSLSVDRIDTHGAYEISNIRPMGLFDNASHRFEGTDDKKTRSLFEDPHFDPDAPFG